MQIITEAYLDHNLGDDLMVSLLVKRFPEHQFHLFSNTSVIRTSLSRHPNIIMHPWSEYRQVLPSADFHLTIGGSLYQVRTRREALSRTLKLRRIQKIHRDMPSAVIGANIGPLAHPISECIVKQELRGLDLLTVRDQWSFRFVERMRCKIGTCLLADDIVYNMEAASLTQTPDIPIGLGISAYRSMQAGEVNAKNYQALAALADAYVARTERPVYLFAFDTENENDLAAAHQIRALSKCREALHIVPYLGDPLPALQNIKACERMVALRFHSAILADILQIPFLPVIYSNKMQAWLEDRNYRGLSLPLQGLVPEAVTQELIDQLLSGEVLFRNFIRGHGTAPLHFSALSTQLSKAGGHSNTGKYKRIEA